MLPVDDVTSKHNGIIITSENLPLYKSLPLATPVVEKEIVAS